MKEGEGKERGNVKEGEGKEGGNVKEGEGKEQQKEAVQGGEGSVSGKASEAASPVLLTALTTFMSGDLNSHQGQQKFLIQLNTLRTLVALRPEVEPVVFSEDPVFWKECAKLNVQVVKSFPTNPHGTPYLRPFYDWAAENTTSPMYGYMNGDILFNTALTLGVKAVLENIKAKGMRERVLMTGRRTNFQMPFPLTAEDDWNVPDGVRQHDLDVQLASMGQRGRLFQTDAEDFCEWSYSH